MVRKLGGTKSSDKPDDKKESAPKSTKPKSQKVAQQVKVESTVKIDGLDAFADIFKSIGSSYDLAKTTWLEFRKSVLKLCNTDLTPNRRGLLKTLDTYFGVIA